MRKSYGAFKSVDDLLAIKGIGQKRLAKMRKYLTVSKPAQPAKSPPAAQSTSRPAKTLPAKKSATEPAAKATAPLKPAASGDEEP